MANEKDDIELLMLRVEDMRTAQRDYFARRMPADKKLAMGRESGVDELLKTLRRRGYNPERFRSSTEQKKMF